MLIDLIYKFTGCCNLSPSYFVSVWWIMGGFFALLYFLFNGYYTKHLDLNLFLLISVLGLLTFIGNIIYLISVKKVTNPGLSRAVWSGSMILFVTIISSIIFKKYISLEKIFAIICILLGIGILLINDN